MRLLCLGDVAISGSLPASLGEMPPGGFVPGGDDRILFNFEIPAASEVNPLPCGSRPRLTGFPESVKILASWAPAIATLANNHALDAGEAGLLQTCRLLQTVGIEPIGAVLSESEPDSPYYWETAEGSVAIFNWVFPEAHPDWMQIPGPACWPGCSRAAALLADARIKADWVLAVLHWSDELFPYPRPEDRETARFLAEAGVDAVIGQHPHVVRGMESFSGCPVFYSLGNYYFSDLQGPHGEWVSREAPRNREGLGVLLQFSPGEKLTWSAVSFWRKQDEVIPDRYRRAERRLENTSQPLHKRRNEKYPVWYRKKRFWFDRVGYRLHFRMRQMRFKEMASAGFRRVEKLVSLRKSG